MAGTFEVYEGTDADGNHVLYGQTYNDNHQPTGEAIQITPPDSYGAAVLTLDNGSVVVQYENPVTDPDQTEGAELYITEFTASGERIDFEDIGLAGGNSGYTTFDPIAIGNNAYVATIRSIHTDFGFGDVRESLRFVDASGHAKVIPLYGEGFSDSPFPAERFSDPTVTALANGGFSVSYSSMYEQQSAEFPVKTPGTATYGATYDAMGDLVRSTFIDYGHNTDLVMSSVSTVLSPTLRNLTLIGTGSIDGRGDALNNIIIGNVAKNHLEGAAGDDRLDGGLGSDYLGGGSGKDTFVFDTAISPKFNSDTIGDFEHGVDKIELSSKIFSYYKAGALPVTSFSDVGSDHPRPGAHIIYDTHGNLFYDPDGAGTAAAPIQFATLNGHPQLTSTDFVVV